MTQIYDQSLLMQDCLELGYNDLIKKYDPQRMSEEVFANNENGNSILGSLKLLRFGLVFQFFPKNSKLSLDDKQKNAIVNTIAHLQNQDINELKSELAKINPNLIIPADFALPENQKQALRIINAWHNIKKALANQMIFEYDGDSANLFKMTDEQIQALNKESDNLINRINNERDKINNLAELLNYRIKPESINKISDFLTRIGRAELFVRKMKDNPDTDNLLQILTKFNTACNIAIYLKSLNLSPQNLTESARAEMKKYLYSRISL